MPKIQKKKNEIEECIKIFISRDLKWTSRAQNLVSREHEHDKAGPWEQNNKSDQRLLGSLFFKNNWSVRKYRVRVNIASDIREIDN